MAGSPQWKVYDHGGTYQAACKELIAAVSLAGLYCDGATVRWGHKKSHTVWTEGPPDGYAGDSYDHAVAVCRARYREQRIDPVEDEGPRRGEVYR